MRITESRKPKIAEEILEQGDLVCYVADTLNRHCRTIENAYGSKTYSAQDISDMKYRAIQKAEDLKEYIDELIDMLEE